MTKNFKKNLLMKCIFSLIITLSICTFIFILLHINYMKKTSTYYLQQTSGDCEKLILNSIGSVKSSTDLLANNLSILPNLQDPKNQNMIESLVSTNKFIKRVFITDINGMQIAKYPSIGNINISHRDYFKKAMEGMGSYSDIIISPLTGESIIIYCTPIKTNNKIIGTVSSIFEIKSLSNLLACSTKDLNCTFGILDNKGSLLLTNKRNSILNSKPSSSNKIVNLSNLEPVKKLIHNESGSGKFILNNTKTLVNYRCFKNSKLNLIIAIPYRLISSSILIYTLIGIGILIIILFFSVIMINNFTNELAKPIINLSEIFKKLSQGNLNIQVDKDLLNRKDEFSDLGKNFKIFLNKIKLIIQPLQENAQVLNKHSNNLVSLIQDNKDIQLYISDKLIDVNTKMDINLNSLKDSLFILQQFSDGINNISFNLENLNEVVHIATNSALEGSNHANNIELTLDDSLNSLKNINKKMSYLTNTSNEINSLVEIINNLAKQTNLLAINAAIEASRAGESGKGFSVVAEQIKKLANKSAISSKNINSLLKNIQSEIFNTSKIVNIMNVKFKNLINNTKITTKLMEDIKNKSINSQTSVEEIIAIIEEQTASIEENTSSLTAVVGYINETVQISHSVDIKLKEQAESLRSLSEVSSSLNDMSSTIKTNIDFFK
ncbi:methyl-accepting chemotaxis protein [Clostridium niameyense]|uniref:Methyl-accepting chemotaxis protein n=2 Tax=Clostridium niameyense TaxID=1622073 RepID=A0A6M0RCR3_9CLOT|nr:methyl-accepting chemotaxis protein [Clostridium niameyense]